MNRLVLFLYVCVCAVGIATAQLRPTNEELGSIYFAYPAPNTVQTPPPVGFEAFYISHYGRHGSRWRTDDMHYKEVVDVFDSLATIRALTPLGEEVRGRLHRVWEDARGRSGNITPLGERQHRDIAYRMFTSFPSVFADSAVVDARSSTSLRCAMSMSYFTEALKEQNPQLRVSRRAYQCYMDYIAHTSPEAEAFCSDTAAWRTDFRRFEQEQIRPERFVKALVAPSVCMSYVQERKIMEGLYWIAIDMQNCDHLKGVDFFDLFTYDELMALWKVVNARMYVCNAAAPLNGGLMPRQASALLRNIVESADLAIAAGQPCSDLRFGHDTHLIRLLALLRVEGCDGSEVDIEKFHLAWQDYRVSPMAANLQLIFFRNAGGQILVKLLHNEHEVRLTGLAPASDPYYYWADLRRHLWGLLDEAD